MNELHQDRRNCCSIEKDYIKQGLAAGMIQVTGDYETQWYCEGRLHSRGLKSSVVLPLYKGKGNPMECGSYGGTKLLEHAMKVVERIFKDRIWQQIDIDMQFGFMKGTTDTICIVRQMQKFRAKGKSSLLALWIWKKLLIGFQQK